MTPPLTRRRLLGSAAAGLGGAAALTLLPPSVQKAVAAGPRSTAPCATSSTSSC